MRFPDGVWRFLLTFLRTPAPSFLSRSAQQRKGRKVWKRTIWKEQKNVKGAYMRSDWVNLKDDLKEGFLVLEVLCLFTCRQRSDSYPQTKRTSNLHM